MAEDITKLAFSSSYPIDKIVSEPDQVSYVVGATTTVTQTIPSASTYTRLPTMKWSTNNADFYPMGAYNDQNASYGANIAVDTSNVYIYLENNTGASVTFYIKYVLDLLT